MKKLLFIIAFAMPYLSLYSQDNENWIYKPSFQVVEAAKDSGLFKTKVFIDFNTTVANDSSLIILKLGYTKGSDDLFHKEILYTPALFVDPEVSVTNQIIHFYLGEFDMPENKYPATLEILVK